MLGGISSVRHEGTGTASLRWYPLNQHSRFTLQGDHATLALKTAEWLRWDRFIIHAPTVGDIFAPRGSQST